MNTGRRWAAAGAGLAAIAIALGAFGAHSLRDRFTDQQLGWWQTGNQYLMYGAIGTILAGLAGERIARPGLPAAFFLLGGVVFGGSLFGLALNGPRVLGAVAPVGGSLLIAGFSIFAVQLWRGVSPS